MGWKLIEKVPVTEQRVVGRWSDGSDRQVIQETRWQARVLDGDGREHQLTFAVDPTDAQILAALPGDGRTLTPTRKTDLERYLHALFQDWQMWDRTHAEAVARSETVALVAALLARRDQAWDDYRTGLNAWRTAP